MTFSPFWAGLIAIVMCLSFPSFAEKLDKSERVSANFKRVVYFVMLAFGAYAFINGFVYIEQFGDLIRYMSESNDPAVGKAVGQAAGRSVAHVHGKGLLALLLIAMWPLLSIFVGGAVIMVTLSKIKR